MSLLSRSAQRVLASWNRALAVDADAAVQQLTQWTDKANGTLLADTERDATSEDMYGPLTDAGLTQQGVVRSNLLVALQDISKYTGGFVTRCWDNPQPLTPDNATPILQNAEEAANAGKHLSDNA